MAVAWRHIHTVLLQDVEQFEAEGGEFLSQFVQVVFAGSVRAGLFLFFHHVALH